MGYNLTRCQFSSHFNQLGDYPAKSAWDEVRDLLVAQKLRERAKLHEIIPEFQPTEERDAPNGGKRICKLD